MTTDVRGPLDRPSRRAVAWPFAITTPPPARAATDPIVTAERAVACLSDEGTVRACLVPRRRLEPPNIKIGDTGMLLVQAPKGDEKEKHVHFRRNGQRSTPSVHVQRHEHAARERSTVRFDLAKTLSRATCGSSTPQLRDPNDQGARAGSARNGATPASTPHVSADPDRSDRGRRAKGVTCDTRPVQGKLFVRQAATARLPACGNALQQGGTRGSDLLRSGSRAGEGAAIRRVSPTCLRADDEW